MAFSKINCNGKDTFQTCKIISKALVILRLFSYCNLNHKRGHMTVFSFTQERLASKKDGNGTMGEEKDVSSVSLLSEAHMQYRANLSLY